MRRRRSVDIVGRRKKPAVDLHFDGLPAYDPRDPERDLVGQGAGMAE